MQVTTARLTDGTGFAIATWFGRRYIERRVRAGDELLLSGKVKHRNGDLVFEGPEFQPADAANLLHVGRIVPVYRLTSGLTANRLRAAMRVALDGPGTTTRSTCRTRSGPPRTCRRSARPSSTPTTRPRSRAATPRSAASRSTSCSRSSWGWSRGGAPAAAPARWRSSADAGADGRIRSALEASLARKLGEPAALTGDQATAIDEIRDDLARPVPMLRLVQGDVGSGKTAVAAWALAAAALDGRQAALLAPTDLLARQHHVTLTSLLEDLGLPITLLTGSLSAEGRRNATEALASGQAAIVVGTHALLQESVAFADLALAVVDEQHRFGVEQRGALEAKATRGAPHVLLMTATPIPRTLGQVLYADLDVSTLRTPPAGRLPIRTGIRRPDDLEGTWQRVRDEAAEGRRTFVVVPRIGAATASADDDGGDAADGVFDDDELIDEDVETEWAAAAEVEYERLTTLLAPLRVGLVHGRLKPADRDAEMARFRDGDLDVLVGTTVVEVGVDVPEATMMVVEGADRFGLAQLHQLRGRVGRGTVPSFCVLVSTAAEGTTEHERLKAVASTTDGFALAERDFELRREGDVLGLAQSGLPRLRVATLANPEHRELAARARTYAEALVGDDGELTDGGPALAHELAAGWLRNVFAGDPASAASAA